MSARNPYLNGRMKDIPGLNGANAEPLTTSSVVAKTGFSFAVLLLGGIVGWYTPVLALPAALIAFVLGLVLAFKSGGNIPAWAVLLYAGIEGVALGAVTMWAQTRYPGIALAAVLGTLVAFMTVFAAYMFGARSNPKLTRIVLIGMVAYIIYLFASIAIQAFTGFSISDTVVFGLPLGVILGVFAVGMGVYCLLMDFTEIGEAVDAGAPDAFGWTLAFGLMLSIIWVYLEILRLLEYVYKR